MNLVDQFSIYPSQISQIACFYPACIAVASYRNSSVDNNPGILFSTDGGYVFKQASGPSGVSSIIDPFCSASVTCYAVAYTQNNETDLLYSAGSLSNFQLLPLAQGLTVTSLTCFSSNNCLITGSISGSAVIYSYSAGLLAKLGLSELSFSQSEYSMCLQGICFVLAKPTGPGSSINVLVSNTYMNGFVYYATLSNLDSIKTVACSNNQCFILGYNNLTNEILYSIAFPSLSISQLNLSPKYLISSVTCEIYLCYMAGSDLTTAQAVVFGINNGVINKIDIPSVTGEITDLSCAKSGQCLALGQDPISSSQFLIASNANSSWILDTIPAGFIVESVGCNENLYGDISCLIAGNNTLSNQGSIYYLTSNGLNLATIDLNNSIGSIDGVGCLSSSCFLVGTSAGGDGLIIRVTLPSYKPETLSFPQLDYASVVQSISCGYNYCVIGVNQNMLGKTYFTLYRLTQLAGGQLTIEPIESLDNHLGKIEALSCFSFNCVAIGQQNDSSYGVSYEVFYSVDYAKVFKQSSLPSDLYLLNSVSCQMDFCVLAGQNDYFQPAVFISKNYGASFDDVAQPVYLLGNINSVSCVYSFCLAAGSINYGTTASAIIWQSGPSGFVSLQNPGLKQIYSIGCQNSHYCILTGQRDTNSSNVIMTTNDGGTSWSIATVNPFNYGNVVDCLITICLVITYTSSDVNIYSSVAPVATISSLTPDSGPINGGNLVSIKGWGFAAVSSVSFGNHFANFTVASPDLIVVTVPPGSAGIVPVVVATSSGVSEITLASQYLYVSAAYFNPISPPFRMCDTRITLQTSLNCPAQALGPNQVGQISFKDIVPSDAVAVMVNITAINPSSDGYLSIWPYGIQMSSASSVIFNKDKGSVASLVNVALGTDDQISVYNSAGITGIAVDVIGYWSSSGLGFNAVKPSRIVDTRSYLNNDFQDANNLIKSNQVISFSLNNTVPSSATAAVFNVTALDASSNNDYLTLWPTGATKPNISNLNIGIDQIRSNQVVVALGTNKNVSLYNALGNINVIVDVVGYYASNGYKFQPIAETRLVDTRSYVGNEFVGNFSPMIAGQSQVFNLSDYKLLSINASFISGVVTITDTTSFGYLEIYPSNENVPTIPDLAWLANGNVSNDFISSMDNESIAAMANLSSCNIILDIYGWFE